MADFEIFSRRLLSLKSDPHVTIQRRGAISMNKSAFTVIGSPDAVELLYDRRARMIGLRGAPSNADHAYPVRQTARTDGGPWVISAMAFTRFYDIDTSITRRWGAYLDDDVLCVDLTAQAIELVGNRSKVIPLH